MDIARTQITGGILAGGGARRLGGVDKGWYAIDGRPLIEHTLARLEGQCGTLQISANRSLPRYRRLGVPVHADDNETASGPLAGVSILLRAAATPYLLIVPVDTPALPLDLAARLGAAMRPSSQIAIARCDGRLQPLHALLRRDALAALEQALAAGIRAVRAWQDRLASVVVDWPDAAGFANINTEADARAFDVSR